MVFNLKWFQKYQEKILWLANTPLVKVWFRRILRISKDINPQEKITEITPNSFSWGDKIVGINKEGKYLINRTTDFRTHEKFGKRLYHSFRYLWLLVHCWDMVVNWLRLPQLNFGFDTLTVYPDPGTGGDTVDGRVKRAAVNEHWTTIIAAAGNGADQLSTTALTTPFSTATSTSGNYANHHRTILTFDTSPIGSSSVINSSNFSLWGLGKNNSLGWSAAHIALALVGATPASDNNLVAADYQQLGSTRFASDYAYASFGSGGYNVMTLNASGLAGILKTGITGLGNMFAVDLDAGTPAWSSGGSAYYESRSADQTGTANDPKLVVNYTVVSFIPKIIMF